MEQFFVPINEVAIGSKLIADGGFIGDAAYCDVKSNGDYGLDFYCIDEGTLLEVQADEGGLFIPCRAGNHYLDGQFRVYNGVKIYTGLKLERSCV